MGTLSAVSVWSEGFTVSREAFLSAWDVEQGHIDIWKGSDLGKG